MKKNTLLWILVGLVVFFFVFGMGRSVYEGFECGLNYECPNVPSGGKTYCGACNRGTCGKGKVKIKGARCN
jgi:hypothetical protein